MCIGVACEVLCGGVEKETRSGSLLGDSWLGSFLVVFGFFGFGLGFSFGFFGDNLVFGVGGGSSRGGRLSISGRSGDGVALGSESGVTLDEDDDTFDEAPDAATHDSDVGDEHEEAEEEAHERDLGGQGDHDGGKDGQKEATTGEGDMHDAFFVFAEVPVVGTEGTEEDAEEAGSDGRFDGGRDAILEEGVRRGLVWGGARRGVGLVGVWCGVWIHKISLDNGK